MAGFAVALAFCLVAFLASGGVDLATNTWVEIGLLVLAGVTAVGLILLGARGRLWGGATLLLFGALAALTYASIAWSVRPSDSWTEANRTLSYLAAFAAALMLARLVPERWRGLVGGTAVAATVVCGYALLVKVFPATFDAGDQLGRLQAPFGYWNAVGLMGALGIAPCLWAGSRQEGSRYLRALSMPAIAILVAALLLSQSRGAVIVAVIGTAVWFLLAPLRLRSALVFGVGAAAGGAIGAWGLATTGISADGAAQALRNSAGHTFGVVILVVLILAAAVGLAAVTALDRVRISPRVHRAVATALLVGVALLPVAGVGALAASSRGLTGEVSHIWNSLTNPNGVVTDQPGRLVELSNSRPHYWSQAITLGEHHLLAGVGALGFATAQPSSASPIWNAQHSHSVHAHGYLAETFADFGLIGLAVSLALLVAWWLATARTLELAWPWRRAARRPPPSHNGAAEPSGAAYVSERTGLVALLAVVVTFGVHSLIDWTWFIPGNAVPALACAGWLAGRGPLSRHAARLSAPRRLTRVPAAAGAVATIAVLALVGVWVIVQPLRAFDSYTAAYTAADAGNARTALQEARDSAAENPVYVDPLFLLSLIYNNLGDPASARHELTQAVSRQPSNPATWAELGCYDYAHHNPQAGRELHQIVSLQSVDSTAQTDPAVFCSGVLP